ncbi:MAG: tetratricopeptide repeat protein [Deltaproteobacteria bacterium]|nr:tetratricopeptide repeat protein [Deltaproteobacteria bacterium]MDQ3296691.1 tetratricopeptide repeat protein [Myxococcota bacterium]
MKLVALVVLALLTGCPSKDRNESVKASNLATKAYSQKQFETAIENYQKATSKWKENHTAWYGLAGAYIGKKDWKSAAEAMEKAVQIDDDQPMYQLYYGVTLYEKAIQQAREDQARRENKKPEEVTPDLASINFEKAIQHLQQATKLNPDLWRAHYYLGRIYRDTGKAKEAAEAYTKALSSAPPDPGPWVALGELYRQWDYTDQAIAVGEQGVAAVPGANEKSDIWYVVGMGYDDKGLYDKSIEAFTKALESRRDNHKAKFQRGQAYFRKGDYTNAKRDLEDFAKAGGSSVEFAKQQASKMLMDIAAKSHGGGGGAAPSERLSPEDLVKKGKG